MISKQDIQNLADLARIEIKEEEIESYRSKLEGVLGYVSEVQKLASEDGVSDEPETPAHHNAFRKDENPHESGIYTAALLKNAPESEKGYIKVRKIL